MSKAPARGPEPESPAKRSRSFARRRKAQRARPSRRRSAQPYGSPAAGVWALLRRAPAAAWICALVALLNATAWSVVVPPFQGRDEIDHFAYVAQLAETGALPHLGSQRSATAPGEALAIQGLHYWQVRFTPYTRSISADSQQRRLMRYVHAGLSLKGTGEAGGAAGEPPLFYALQTVPYALGGGNILNKLQLMRLLSALLGGITALLVFLFLRETLPSVPWAATVGALCVALQPTFAFVTGSVNPDALIYPISAGVFLCLAYAFRRAFTHRVAVALGVLIAAGLATYFSFIGVAAGALVGVAILAARGVKARGRGELVAPALATGIGVAPGAIYALHNIIAGRALFGQASTVGGALDLGRIWHEISYIWQLYLPRLPAMTHYFRGIETWREVWFDRSVGLYGWMDTMFPGWVDSVALICAVPVALLLARELYRCRGRVRARLPELSGYAAITLGVLVMLGVTSYYTDVVKHELALGEPRYLLPMLPLLGAAIALAARGAGRRWMYFAGTGLIVLFLGHDLFSQLQVIARYYG